MRAPTSGGHGGRHRATMPTVPTRLRLQFFYAININFLTNCGCVPLGCVHCLHSVDIKTATPREQGSNQLTFDRLKFNEYFEADRAAPAELFL